MSPLNKPVSPEKYLKKTDLKKMEEIKQELGQETEMKIIRDKYKLNQPTQKYIGMVPLYKRHGYSHSLASKKLFEEIQDKRNEIKLKAQPIDYQALKEHQDRVDKVKAERLLNQSTFVNRSEDVNNESLLAIEEGLLKGKIKQAKIEFRKNQDNVKDFLNKYDFKELRVPNKLLKFKHDENAWLGKKEQLQEIEAIRKEKGHQFSQEFLEKAKSRIQSASRIQSQSQITLKISTTSDLNSIKNHLDHSKTKLQSLGDESKMVTRENGVPVHKEVSKKYKALSNIETKEKGNHYFSETNKKYNSSNVLKNILKGTKKIEDSNNFKAALSLGLIMENRAEKADRVASNYGSPSSSKIHSQLEIIEKAGDQWVNAIEAKLGAISILDSKPKIPSNRKDDPFDVLPTIHSRKPSYKQKVI